MKRCSECNKRQTIIETLTATCASYEKRIAFLQAGLQDQLIEFKDPVRGAPLLRKLAQQRLDMEFKFGEQK